MTLRQLTGFVKSLFTLINKVFPISEFSRLSKRMSTFLPRLNRL
ncbi:MAG: transposase [Alphaproteobacteria bacterium]|nr:transposase [Alphaproteobacteria bacterium]